jgi:hypothetical protein
MPALYQGPTLVGPLRSNKDLGFSPCRYAFPCFGLNRTYPRNNISFESYGKIMGTGSSVVYQTDKESLDVGWKFTTMILSETV